MNCGFCDRDHDITMCDHTALIHFESRLTIRNRLYLGRADGLHEYLALFSDALLIAFAKKKGMIVDNVEQATDFIYTLSTIPTLDIAPSYMEDNNEPPNLTDVLSDSDSDSLPELVDISDDNDEFIPFHNGEYNPLIFSNVLSQWILLGRLDELEADTRKWQIELTKEIPLTNHTCDCGICYEEKNIHSMVTFSCNHDVCDSCIVQQLKATRASRSNMDVLPACAFCRARIEKITLRNENITTELQEYIGI